MANSFGSTFDSVLSVVEVNSECGDRVCITESDDYNSTTQESSLYWQTKVGVVYKLVLAKNGWQYDGTYYELNVTVRSQYSSIQSEFSPPTLTPCRHHRSKICAQSPALSVQWTPICNKVSLTRLGISAPTLPETAAFVPQENALWIVVDKQCVAM